MESLDIWHKYIVGLKDWLRSKVKRDLKEHFLVKNDQLRILLIFDMDTWINVDET